MLNQLSYRKIEQDNGFIIQHIDDIAQFSTFIEKKKAGKTTFFLRDTQNYVYRRISVEYTWRILRALWPYLDIVTMCWIIINNYSMSVRWIWDDR